MRLQMRIMSGVVGMLLLAGVAAGTVSAQAEFKTAERGSVVVREEQSVDGSVYLAGETVRVAGVVDGDVHCAGSSIVVDGTVSGDVLCAGADVTVNGVVQGDVRALAANVIVNGQVQGSVSVLATSFELAEDAVVQGDVSGAVERADFRGVVERDVALAASEIRVSGSINRNANIYTEQLTIDDTATIAGSLVYSAPQSASIADGAVGGDTSFTQREVRQDTTVAVAVVALLFSVMIGLTAVLGTAVAPRFVKATADVAWSRVGIASIVGLTFITLAPIAAVLAFISQAGAIIGYILLLLWLLLMAVSPVPVSYVIGSRLLAGRNANVMIRAVVGALILIVLLVIPVLNIFMFMAMLFIGTGLVLLRLPEQYQGHAFVAESPAKKRST